MDSVESITTAKEVEDLDLTPIQKFYSNAHIFITGSTGLLGSALLEKLLRSCPSISKIYLLLRNKKEKNIETRLNEMFDNVLFDTVRNECPKFRQKLFGVEGDCALPELGLSLQDKKLLTDEVTIIFHLAATVRFDEKLKTAVAINVCAPRDLLKLAHQMPNLKSLVHVSTVYTNCIYDVIDEKVHPATLDYEKLILLAKNLPENILDNVTPELVGKYPNTYTYTKQMAETIIKAESQGLPIGISRPSIVISTYKEPIPGWINNVYNITGVAAASAMGVLRIISANPDCIVNAVPLDMYVNSLIATAWEIDTIFMKSVEENLPYEIPVYNYESSNDKPISYRRFVDLTIYNGRNFPPSKSVWYPILTFTNSYFVCLVNIFFLHTIPAILSDGVLLCMGKSPRMLKIYSKINKFFMMFTYFSTSNWTFKCQNTQKLQGKLSEKDKKIFFSDLGELDWDTYFKTYFTGIRLHILKDPLDNVPKALVWHKWLYFAHQTVKSVVGILVIWILWCLFALIYNSVF